MVFQLDDKLWFPDPHLADDDEYGMLAVGGDLSADRLLLAYQHGIFPWYAYKLEDQPVWFCPQQRFVIFPSEIHVSHSMRTLINKHRYHLTIDRDFPGVISSCSQAQKRDEAPAAWLGDDIIKAYTALHRQGFAHSIEVWDTRPDASTPPSGLVGGLYGVGIGSSFFGESMFSLVPSASKLALIFLARFLACHGGRLIDCQFETPHLKSMGGRFISYDEYMKIIVQPL